MSRLAYFYKKIGRINNSVGSAVVDFVGVAVDSFFACNRHVALGVLFPLLFFLALTLPLGFHPYTMTYRPTAS